jgi:hypothetical protein
MHLLWETSKIYLKPLPRYLLSSDFWKHNLICKDCNYLSETTSRSRLITVCRKRKLYSLALGLLHSYMQLIRYESDFAIAKEEHLVPSDLD